MAFPRTLHAAFDLSQNEKAAGSRPKTEEEARQRFEDARKSVDDLLSNYVKISKGGGDNIRRYLGTVGTTSSLYGIKPVFKLLQDSSDDIVEFTENMNDFDRYLTGADGQAYSSMFVEFSAAKGTSQDYYDAALVEIKAMRDCLVKMEKELK